jgi:hypothetical protein
MNPIYYVTVTREPKPVTSQVSGREERMCSVEYEGNEYKIYWQASTQNGQPRAANYLAPGDVIAVEWNGKKFKLCSQQAPELLQKLAQRAELHTPPAQRPSPHTAPLSAVAAAAPGRSLEEDCAEMVQCFVMLRRSLSNVPDEQIQAMACTIWIQRNRK